MSVSDEARRRPGSVEHLKALLATAIEQRGQLIEMIDRHWYVPGERGQCLACGQPGYSSRHAPRRP